MRPYKAVINIKDEQGNILAVSAECIDVDCTDQPTSFKSTIVKFVYIDGHSVTVGIDGSFYHPVTKVLYKVK